MLSEIAPFSNEVPQSGSTLFSENCIEPPKPPKPPKPPHNTSVGDGLILMITFLIIYIYAKKKLAIRKIQRN